MIFLPNLREECVKKGWKNTLKIPLSSPTVYSPLILLTMLTCLLQCSGSAFIKKFLIQILSSEAGESQLNYFLPILILSVRLVVTLLMSFLVHKVRVRLLYFLSLFTRYLDPEENGKNQEESSHDKPNETTPNKTPGNGVCKWHMHDSNEGSKGMINLVPLNQW